MKLLKLISSALLFITLALPAFSQTGPPAPSSGIWAIIDTNYTVGTNTLNVTKAKITLQNTTTNKTTGVQFRVFYDKTAFASASVALVGSSTNLYLQSVDNNANGYVTITLVYTGSSSTYSLANGETFEITFGHVAPALFQALTSISPLSWSGAYPYSQVAAEQPGNDIALSLHNYGGIFYLPHLNYHGTFTNVTGSGAKNLTLALQKQPKTGGSWSVVNTYTTDVLGKFTINQILDTTFYNVRLAVQGDTMGVGNVISVADAQQINQWTIGGATPTAWDFYHADVNGDNSLSISDAYGVFGRIAGRFSVWPNSVKDVKFFTVAEYNAVNGTPATNFTSTYPGTTNFTFNILPGQPDSVTFYVMVPGDANNTGYHMARLTPIEILNPTNAPNHLIDEAVEYDFVAPTIEVNVPSLTVDEGNLVKLPVKVFTGGNKVGALQLALKFDSELLEFKQVLNSEKSMNWMSFINPMDSVIEWGGYDRTNGENLFIDGETVFTLTFLAKSPKDQWGQSPLYTTRKFVGDASCGDMNIIPTNGLYQVKMIKGVTLKDNEILVYPNPTTGEVTIKFNVPIDGNVTLSFVDVNGRVVSNVLNEYMPSGNYTYKASLSGFTPGSYYTTMTSVNAISVNKTILINQ
jgi:hypothetical protein